MVLTHIKKVSFSNGINILNFLSKKVTLFGNVKRKVSFSNDINISSLLSKKAILFENVKRENCKLDLILQYFHWKGVNITKNDVHIMTNIFTRPTGRVMVLIENVKKQNFDFDFDFEKDKEEEEEKEKGKENTSANIITNSSTFVSGTSTGMDRSISSGSNEHSSETNVSSTDRDRTNRIVTQNDDKRLAVQTKQTSCFDLSNLFSNCKIHICDDYVIERFIEECERFIRFTEDIKRISKFENLNKIVSIINIPNCYGRKQLYDIIYENTKVKVQLKNIIFRFKKNGTQSDCAYILCDTVKDANLIIHKIQELPVAKKYHLKEFYGASFLYASRNNLFISNEQLDYLLIFSKYKIFTCGWHKDITIKEFENFLITLKIFPCKIIKVLYEKKKKKKLPENLTNTFLTTVKTNPNHISITIEEPENEEDLSKKNDIGEKWKNSDIDEENSVSFILFFENMRMTKKVFTKLERLKKKWKIATSNNFYAYPKLADLHFDDDDNYADENEYEDSDLDEEIEY